MGGWRAQGWEVKNPVSKDLAYFWVICEPLLFGLIGTEIELASLDPTTVGWGVLIVLCSSLVRLIATYPALLKAGLTLKEKIFVDLAWIPAGFVALGPKALDLAREACKHEESELTLLWIQLGETFLTITVLGLLITAPIGAMAMMTSGPILLETSLKQNEKPNNQEMEKL